MVQRLDAYVRGNQKALAIVRVPSVEEERARSVSRLRSQVREHRQCLEAQGRTFLMYYGYRMEGRWWKTLEWERLKKVVSEDLIQLLARIREMLLEADRQVKELVDQLEAAAPEARVKGEGALTHETIAREVGAWDRFRNRRQVGSYMGLCPGEHSSGDHRRQGHITKHGNPRLRHAFIEMAWRVIRYQPHYWAVKRHLRVSRLSKVGNRKKMVVAIARCLAVDLWRIHTGRVQPDQLGLAMNT